ncbi:MAG: methionine--tRNA ligase [Verrucomicrobia bacterium]|nr:MAG: methionine--tRNA ligase [Verrucomicrobiota bacterium]
MSSRFTITTAIDYTNAAPHIGHAYEKILADVIARFQRLRGREVLFITGVDQHGQKVKQAAENKGISPQEFANSVTAKFTSLWDALGISYDRWAATTDPTHKEVVRKILRKLYEAGDLYKSTHSGFYSVRQEQFLTDKDRNEAGEFGPEWGEVTSLQEDNWYFRLTSHFSWLLKFVESHPEFVLPGFRQAEVINALRRGGQDLCISRPKSRLSWGIELPFDSEFVTYVWFDALINYISFAGYLASDPEEEKRFWDHWPALHVIGKDIMVPAHAIYWPIMLHAMGFSDERIPRLLVHGWWNRKGLKISKSLGNAVDPVELVSRYGSGPLRYYFVRDIATGQDADFNEERLVMLYNSELANGIGNLLNRTLNMAHRYLGGAIRSECGFPEGEALRQERRFLAEQYFVYMEAFEINSAIDVINKIATLSNIFAENTAPWALAKDPSQKERLEGVLKTLCESIWLIASLLTPILPRESTAMLQQLNMKPINFSTPNLDISLIAPLIVGKPTPVFPKIELESDQQMRP